MSDNRSQWYIGAPNGIVLCINSRRGSTLSGELYHSYREDAVYFRNIEEMTRIMESLYDELQYPHLGTNQRSFVPVTPTYNRYAQERNRIMSDERLLSKHGDIGTFIVRVQHRQNSSWQGRVTWMEQNQTLNFRSIWEMIKLIESAMDTVSIQEEEGEEEAWAVDFGSDSDQ